MFDRNTPDSQQPTKKKQMDSGMDISVSVLHDYLDLRTTIEMFDYEKGLHIFPRTPIRDAYSSVFIDGLRFIDDIHNRDKQVSLLNTRVIAGRSEQFVASYLERSREGSTIRFF